MESYSHLPASLCSLGKEINKLYVC